MVVRIQGDNNALNQRHGHTKNISSSLLQKLLQRKIDGKKKYIFIAIKS